MMVVLLISSSSSFRPSVRGVYGLLYYLCQEQDPGIWPSVAQVTKDTLLIRYTLLPHLYTLHHKAHTQGSTVLRPLFFEYVRSGEGGVRFGHFGPFYGDGQCIYPRQIGDGLNYYKMNNSDADSHRTATQSPLTNKSCGARHSSSLQYSTRLVTARHL